MTLQDPKNRPTDTNSTDTKGCVDYDILGVLNCFPEETKDLIYNPFFDFLTGNNK